MGRLDKTSTRTAFTSFDIEDTTVRKSNTNRIKQVEKSYDLIPIDLIHIAQNIRTSYDDPELKELSESIKNYGVLQPLCVYEDDTGYTIIFGHRRYYASKLVELKFLPCIICPKPDNIDNIYIQIIENEQKQNVNTQDLEKYVTLLKNKFQQSVIQISKKIGKSESYIYELLNASKTREKLQGRFDKAGINLTSYDMRRLNNLTEAQIDEFANQLTIDPGKKNMTLKTLFKNNSRRRKINSSSKKENNTSEIPIIEDSSSYLQTENSDCILNNSDSIDKIENLRKNNCYLEIYFDEISKIIRIKINNENYSNNLENIKDAIDVFKSLFSKKGNKIEILNIS